MDHALGTAFIDVIKIVIMKEEYFYYWQLYFNYVLIVQEEVRFSIKDSKDGWHNLDITYISIFQVIFYSIISDSML